MNSNTKKITNKRLARETPAWTKILTNFPFVNHREYIHLQNHPEKLIHLQNLPGNLKLIIIKKMKIKKIQNEIVKKYNLKKYNLSLSVNEISKYIEENGNYLKNNPTTNIPKFVFLKKILKTKGNMNVSFEEIGNLKTNNQNNINSLLFNMYSKTK